MKLNYIHFMKLKTLFILPLLFIAMNLYAQSSPPRPLDMSFLNLIEGTWAGQSEIMGTKMNEVVTCRMDLNKQYLIINLRAESEDKAHVYTGMGVYGSDSQGNVKSWWFDDWGIAGISSGEGKIESMKMIIDAKSSLYTMKREMELTGGNLVMRWSSTSKDKDGKDATINGETIYTKTQ